MQSFVNRASVTAAAALLATAALFAAGLGRSDELPVAAVGGYVDDSSQTRWPPQLPALPVFKQPNPGAEDFFALATARGISTAATLFLRAEQGSSVTYSWNTDILRSRNGTESRIALVTTPRETYEITALIEDSALNSLQTALVTQQAAGDAFAVALDHESLIVTACTGTTVVVPSTACSDWTYPGQTVIVCGLDGATTATGVVQSATSTSITLDTNVAGVVGSGGRIMPTIPCYLEDANSVALYYVNAGTLKIKARATYFGNAVGAWSPSGATVTTFTDPFSFAVFPVFDKKLTIQNQAQRGFAGGTILTDRGGALLLTASQSVVEFTRETIYEIYSDADRQWLKAFCGAVFGRQCVFMLPTWRPDFVLASGDASGGLLTVLIATDYADDWLTSLAHTHLQLLMTSGAVNYVTISASVNNHDGTQTLQLDRAVIGSIAQISFLEQCRLDTDDIVVQYGVDLVGSVKLPIRVVQG